MSSAQSPRPQIVITLSREEMKSRALAFAKSWAGPQREEAEAKTFLDQFFEIFGRNRRNVDAQFEHRVEREQRGEGRIDLFWPGKLVVEMKSTGKDLSTAKGGAASQAFDYVDNLDSDERPRWVMVSDFAHFVIYDLGEEVHDYLKRLTSARKTRPSIVAQFRLSDLPAKLHCFAFIRDEEQQLFQAQPEINLRAVNLLGELHDELKKTGYAGHKLERFLVRVLFCLFAEDTDIFEWNSFTRFIQRSKKDGSDLGQRLAQLFKVLDQDTPARSTALGPEFAAFRYINGGLFEERLEIADMTAEHRAALLACCQFDWSKISPGVFGSLFQGVMDKSERRAKGAHYTSEENIRRVIAPLFLDDLKEEFQKISASVGQRLAALRPSDPAPVPDKPQSKPRKKPTSPFDNFHDRLAALRFLDPACGCGNFLVVAYRELRAIELELLKATHGDQLPLELDVGDLARINVDQFYGIELEEFPALIAETALWLTDHQVNMAFSKAFGRHYSRIPLKKSPTIVAGGNALTLDWSTILLPGQCSYILGNPPFVGGKYQDAKQRADMAIVCREVENYGLLDYVCGWYVKAAEYIGGSRIRCAFVSTNSITQGEQAAVLWAYLFTRRIKIHFGHRTFVWHNEASGNAQVHVVIVGFGAFDVPRKKIYEYDTAGKQSVSSGSLNIGPYLIAGSDTVIGNRSTPLCAVPEIGIGNKPIDGGYYLFTPSEREEFLLKEPTARPFFRKWIGSVEFINNIDRWCLWLRDCPPGVLRNMPEAMRLVECVAKYRRGEIPAKAKEDNEKNKTRNEATKRLAETPTRFHVENFPQGEYLVIPKVSSERRVYVPIGFVTPETMASDLLHVMPEATLYHFGVLSSAAHMTWMRTVGGRLKSDYRYSSKLVYNNYPWPEPNTRQRTEIESAARNVLDARVSRLDAGASLADLYDPLVMPEELLKAHRALDHAVDRSYRSVPFAGERERVEFLFGLYEKLVAPLVATKKRKPANVSIEKNL